MAKRIDETNLGYLISKIKAAFWPKTDVVQISIDTTPTANSTNLVTSGGVKNYVDNSIPNVPVQDVTVDGTSVVNTQGVAEVPAIPDDSDLVHKTGAESIGGTKTFTDTISANDGVTVGYGSQLNFERPYNDGNMGPYVMGDYDTTNNQPTMGFFGFDSDEKVRLQNIEEPIANSDAATKNYVDSSIGNATLTIKQGGTTKGTFTANASQDVEINLDAGGGGGAGTLDTTNTTALTPSASESLGGSVNLHKVSKTGTYSDLIGAPMPVNPSTDNAVARFDGTTGDLQDSGVTIDDSNNIVTSGDITLKTLRIQGSYTGNTTRSISSDNASNMYISVGGLTPLVITNTAVRRAGNSSAASIDLGSSAYPWNNAYAKKHVTHNGNKNQFVKGDGSLDSFVYQKKLVAGNDLEIVSINGTLPSGYLMLSFIQSDGTQYIDTGYALTGTDSVEVDYELLNLSASGDKALIGQRPNTFVETYSSSNTWYVRFGSSTSVTATFDSSQTQGTFVIKKQYFAINGTQKATPNFSSGMVSGYNMLIFARIISSTVYGCHAKISQVRVKNSNDELIHTYIPAIRVSDGEVGMYDVADNGGISQGFIAHSGTNPFIAGTVVSGSSEQINVVGTNLVHKTGAETIAGIKTFNDDVNIVDSLLVIDTNDQNKHNVYINLDNYHDDGGDGIAVLSLDDPSGEGNVIIRSVASPILNNDAANKRYVDESKRQAVSLNGRSGAYGLHQQSLVVCAESVSGMTWLMEPLTTSGGTGAKAVNESAKFPIGSKIYYHPDETTFSANTDFTSKTFYSTYNNVDARYSANNGSSLSLGSSSTSNVYLRVVASVSSSSWNIYNKGNIIVTSGNLVAESFYIYLGKTVGSTGYTFQLEDNNPLYYYDGTKLIDWAVYATDLLTRKPPYKKFELNTLEVTSSTQNESPAFASTDNIEAGTYKVTLMRHITYDGSTLSGSSYGLNMVLSFKRDGSNLWTYIAGGTYVMNLITSPNDVQNRLGSVVVFLTGFLTLDTPTQTNDRINVAYDGPAGVVLGADQPIFGPNIEDVENKDFVLFEKM